MNKSLGVGQRSVVILAGGVAIFLIVAIVVILRLSFWERPSETTQPRFVPGVQKDSGTEAFAAAAKDIVFGYMPIKNGPDQRSVSFNSGWQELEPYQHDPNTRDAEGGIEAIYAGLETAAGASLEVSIIKRNDCVSRIDATYDEAKLAAMGGRQALKQHTIERFGPPTSSSDELLEWRFPTVDRHVFLTIPRKGPATFRIELISRQSKIDWIRGAGDRNRKSAGF